MKAIIFDLDGVLVFTDKYHYMAWKKMADSMGIYFDPMINNRLRGVSRANSLEIILERYSGEPLTTEQKQALMDQKNSDYCALLRNMSPADVSEDVRNTLKELRKRGYKLGVGSSSKNTKFILKQVELTEMFDAVSDGTNITKSKPDPEVFLKAAEFLKTSPEECMVVEDAYAGIDAAVSCKMTTAGIGEAAGYQKTDYPIGKLSDLLMIC